jgi:SAM-dependent methyltransferase
LTGLLDAMMQSLVRSGMPPAGLELGASHGPYSDHLLSAGWDVTYVEMSRRMWEDSQRRFGHNRSWNGRLDRDLELADLTPGFSLALCVSVLHHVPDYIALLRRVARQVAPGGSLLTVQDPLWYPRLGRPARAYDRGAYLLWRVRQGQMRVGVRALRRRMRGVMPEREGDEVVYYHVVRQGVDEDAVRSSLATLFDEVEIIRYWSNHLHAARSPARMLGIVNTFAVRAVGRR